MTKFEDVLMIETLVVEDALVRAAVKRPHMMPLNIRLSRKAVALMP